MMWYQMKGNIESHAGGFYGTKVKRLERDLQPEGLKRRKKLPVTLLQLISVT